MPLGVFNNGEQVAGWNSLFPAKLTANDGGTPPLYTWIEQKPLGDGDYDDADMARTGETAREVNDLDIDVSDEPIVLMRFRTMVEGQEVYEFDGAGLASLAGLGSPAFMTYNLAISPTVYPGPGYAAPEVAFDTNCGIVQDIYTYTVGFDSYPVIRYTISPASPSTWGVVSTTSQTFVGVKTFDALETLLTNSASAGAAVSLGFLPNSPVGDEFAEIVYEGDPDYHLVTRNADAAGDYYGTRLDDQGRFILTAPSGSPGGTNRFCIAYEPAGTINEGQTTIPGVTSVFGLDFDGGIYIGGTPFVTVPQGGTGVASWTPYAVICGGTTATGALQQVSGLGTSGQVLTSNGAGNLPTWQTNGAGTVTSVDVSGGSTGLTFSGGPITTSGVLTMAGTLDADNGGTGRTSHTAYAVICGGTSSTSAQQSVSGVGTSGQVLTSNGISALPTWQAITSLGIGATVTSGTTGSVLFVGAGGMLAQDNANFYWDDTNNRLGLGTASPGSRLEVSSTGDTEIRLVTTDTSKAPQLSLKENSTLGAFFCYNGSTSVTPSLCTLGGYTGVTTAIYAGASERMRFDTSGNVMIAKTSSPQAKLDVNGDIAALYTSGYLLKNGSTTLSQIYYSGGPLWERPTATKLQFTMAGTPQLSIASDGNVGINATSPGARLLVKASAGQTENICEWQSSAAAVYGTISENGYWTTRKTSAPADAELATGELALWFDSTAGAAYLKIKAKNASGTVVTGSVALT